MHEPNENAVGQTSRQCDPRAAHRTDDGVNPGDDPHQPAFDQTEFAKPIGIHAFAIARDANIRLAASATQRLRLRCIQLIKFKVHRRSSQQLRLNLN